jgi:hypothetical protein
MTFEHVIQSLVDERERRRLREAEISRLLRVRRAARSRSTDAR